MASVNSTTPQQITKNKAKYYMQAHYHNRFIEIGQRGFLATCNFREKECTSECIEILNTYIQRLSHHTLPPSKQNDEDDIGDVLSREIETTKNVEGVNESNHYKFRSVQTGVRNCVFIQSTFDRPDELVKFIIEDLYKTKEKKTRFLLRLLPVNVVCRANVDDILKSCESLIISHFLNNKDTFSIILNKRYNNNIDRDAIINALAELVHSKNPDIEVNLKKPSKSIIVEIIKGLCCVTVVEDYFKYKKYNVMELSLSDDNQNVASLPAKDLSENSTD